MQIIRSGSDVLTLVQSRSKAGVVFATLCLALVAYCLIILPRIPSSDLSKAFKWVMYGLPLLLLPEFFHQMRIFLAGEKFIFYRDLGSIQRNDLEVARFDEATGIVIEQVWVNEEREDHRLTIKLRDKRDLRITQARKFDEVMEIAELLADFMNVEIDVK